MQKRKNGIAIDNIYSRRSNQNKKIKKVVNEGIYSTLVKYENGLAIWTMVLRKSKDYRNSIAEGFEEVEIWKQKINHELEII